MARDCVGSPSANGKRKRGRLRFVRGHDTIAIIHPPCTYAFHDVIVDGGKNDAHIRLSSRTANRFRDVCGTHRSCVCEWGGGGLKRPDFVRDFAQTFRVAITTCFAKVKKKYNIIYSTSRDPIFPQLGNFIRVSCSSDFVLLFPETSVRPYALDKRHGPSG